MGCSLGGEEGGDVLGDRAGLFWALFVWGCIYQFQTVLSEQNCTNFLARAGEHSFENLKPLQLFCVFRILAAITLSIPDGCVKNTPKRSHFKQQQSCSCFALFSFLPTRL